jgi:hypothetical protein
MTTTEYSKTASQSNPSRKHLGITSMRSAHAQASGTVLNERYFADAAQGVRLVGAAAPRWSPGLPIPKRNEGAEPDAWNALCRNAIECERVEREQSQRVREAA